MNDNLREYVKQQEATLRRAIQNYGPDDLRAAHEFARQQLASSTGVADIARQLAGTDAADELARQLAGTIAADEFARQQVASSVGVADLARQVSGVSAADTFLREERAQQEMITRQVLNQQSVLADAAKAFDRSQIVDLRTLVGGGVLTSQVDPLLARSIAEWQLSYQRQFQTPNESEIAQILTDVTGAGPQIAGVSGAAAAADELMHSMRHAWARVDHWGESAASLLELKEVATLVELSTHFQTDISADLRNSLGDWRSELLIVPETFIEPIARTRFYAERGLEQDLTDFPVATFDEALLFVRLLKHDAFLDEKGEGSEHARGKFAFDCIKRFEREFRQFIDERMRKAFGDDWVQRQLPRGMLNDWLAKRTNAVNSGRVEESALINYADFGDYVKIVIHLENWPKVFAAIFVRQEDVRESLQRLHVVRIATMHSLLITNADMLLLLAETERVYQTIRSGLTL